MIFLGYFLIYVVRYNMSVHIIDMIQITKRDEFEFLRDNDTIIQRASSASMRSVSNNNTLQNSGRGKIIVIRNIIFRASWI